MRLLGAAALLLVLNVESGCGALAAPRSQPSSTIQESTTTVLLHGRPFDLHLARPTTPRIGDVIVLYASGDGGWFGSAVDMFRRIARAGYFAVGFSSRAFLKVERPHGALATASQLTAEYQRILAQARIGLHLDPAAGAVLTGWSRGAAFSVLVGSDASSPGVRLGVVAIGLAEDEDLKVVGAEDETDDGGPAPGHGRRRYDTYARIAQLGTLPVAVIQSTHDRYLPALQARERLGPDTSVRRLYAIDARNHRFSGGSVDFGRALLDALDWITLRQKAPTSALAPARQE